MARKTIYTLALVLTAFMSGCQSDEPFRWNDREVPDTQTVLAFATEGLSQSYLQTRSVDPEREVPTELTLLQFATTADGSGELIRSIPYSPADFTQMDGIYSKLVNRSDLTEDATAYLVANSRGLISGLGENFTESAFRSLAIEDALLLDANAKMPLVSQPIKLTGDMINTTGKVDMFSLHRPYTRVSLKFDSSTPNFLTTGFALWQKPAEAGICSEGESKLGMTLGQGHELIDSPLNGEWAVEGAEPLKYLKDGERFTTDILPVAKEGDPLLIVRGYFAKDFDAESNSYVFEGATESYYAVKLNCALKPNTHYIISVTGVSALGKASAEEASKSPSSVAVVITEETPAINSIVTDGENVLAVQASPVIEADGNGSLTILVRSSEAITEANLADKISISGAEAWLNMTDWSKNATVVNVKASSAESMNGLVTQKIVVAISANENHGLERQSELTVALGNSESGLKRNVTVTQRQKADASLADIFDIKLTIKRGSEVLLAETDYLKFIGATNGSSTLCMGLQQEDNGGRHRNSGLHWPMPNGDVSYIYHISLKPGYSGSVTWPSGVTASGNSTSGWDVTLRSGTTDYENKSWMEGIEFNLGSFYINLDLYHTGFFNKEHTGWRYYEVIEVDGKYWLDRNIGASSAGMMEVSESIGNTWPAREGSGGGWYNNVKNPAPLPEGWVVPTASDMVGLTQGPSFKHNIESSEGHRFFAPTCKYDYKEDGVTLSASSYFPHNGIYNSGSTDGQPKTGYYLTSTNAGKEGWYQIILMSGQEVVRQNLSLSDNADRRASVRAIAKASSGSSNTKKYTCSSKGYTHVFLYNENPDGSRTTINAWPGEQVSMYSTADSRFYQYELTSYATYKNLKVIFNKVNATTGKIEKSSAVKEGTVSSIDELTPNTPGIAFVDGGAYCHCTTGGWVQAGHTCGTVDPGPDPEPGEYYYKINNNDNNNKLFSEDKTMTLSGNVWVFTGNCAKGNFKIQKCKKSDNTVVESIGSEEGNTTVTLNQAKKCKVGGGAFWFDNASSNYTFTFDPSAMTLTITGAGGGTTSKTKYYIFAWKLYGDYNPTHIHLESPNKLFNAPGEQRKLTADNYAWLWVNKSVFDNSSNSNPSDYKFKVNVNNDRWSAEKSVSEMDIISFSQLPNTVKTELQSEGISENNIERIYIEK